MAQKAAPKLNSVETHLLDKYNVTLIRLDKFSKLQGNASVNQIEKVLFNTPIEEVSLDKRDALKLAWIQPWLPHPRIYASS